MDYNVQDGLPPGDCVHPWENKYGEHVRCPECLAMDVLVKDKDLTAEELEKEVLSQSAIGRMYLALQLMDSLTVKDLKKLDLKFLNDCSICAGNFLDNVRSASLGKDR